MIHNTVNKSMLDVWKIVVAAKTNVTCKINFQIYFHLIFINVIIQCYLRRLKFYNSGHHSESAAKALV